MPFLFLWQPRGTLPPARIGDLSKSLPMLTVAATGRVRVTGALAKPLPMLTLAAAGRVRITGTLARSLPALIGTMTGVVRVRGAGSNMLPMLTLVAAGLVASAMGGTQSRHHRPASLWRRRKRRR